MVAHLIFGSKDAVGLSKVLLALGVFYRLQCKCGSSNLYLEKYLAYSGSFTEPAIPNAAYQNMAVSGTGLGISISNDSITKANGGIPQAKSQLGRAAGFWLPFHIL